MFFLNIHTSRLCIEKHKFRNKKGSKNRFIGSTGSGKSTTIDIIILLRPTKENLNK